MDKNWIPIVNKTHPIVTDNILFIRHIQSKHSGALDVVIVVYCLLILHFHTNASTEVTSQAGNIVLILCLVLSTSSSAFSTILITT